MSKRFLRWIEVWIDDNVPVGDGGDIEPFEARAKRMAAQLLTEAKTQGFRPEEITDEEAKVSGMVSKRLGATVEFDLTDFGARTED